MSGTNAPDLIGRSPGGRKLIAVVYSDVVGYSRLIGLDDIGTLERLRTLRSALIDPAIEEYGGRIVQTGGDSLLIVFDSIDGAVQCAVKVQRQVPQYDGEQPADRTIRFRVAINVGDVIAEGTDFHGDAVNVVARLQAECPVGGVCVTRAVRDHVHDRLDLAFNPIGTLNLRNITRPVEAFVIRLDTGKSLDTTAHSPGLPAVISTPPRRRLRYRNVVAASAAGLVAVCALIVAGFWLHRASPSAPQSIATATAAPLPLPDKPSIAVLPFTNIGGDAKQERLADGITEDLITDLSRYHSLFVIARNSVMTYKGKAVSVQQVGRELGVRFVMEGSIQTNGDRVRVTAQLIDAATDTHVWSDRYDRALNDIFEVQNEVTQKIAGTLGGMTGTLTLVDAPTVRRKPPANLTAYDYYVEGQELHYKLTKEDVAKAEVLLKKAIELDPQFARAYYGLGHVYGTQAWWSLSDTDPTVLYERSRDTLLKAIALDPNDALPYSLLGDVYMSLNDWDRAVALFDKAIELNPNDPDVLHHVGGVLPFIGRAKEGAEMVDREFRLNPRYPSFYNIDVDPYYVIGRYNQVITMVRRTVGATTIWVQAVLVMSYAQLGQTDAETVKAKAELLRRYPEFSFERLMSDFGGIPDQPTLALYLDGVRKAGLNECATQAELQKYPNMTHLPLCDAKRATN
jgi:TolB-like protein/class 3 adenylate cyclase